ncbi:DUF1659 domain-containing protein [Sporosarcina sp. HYO08]|uniref:DUF1659 domain-containing protein n=1 Tax=Sporosarcina sp. HYO08 TaxID=1759557 RepID=UPI00079BB27C|nr:DUF1659 domain-containing protein [Sporosarcina sp. HYO08]KXH81708.1 hypothetical protein AU377_05430 [Sporosarcina sp. HYO08]
MVTIEFQHAVGRVYFEAGQTEDGKVMRKSKTYRNIAKNASPDNLYNALEQLALLSALPFIGAEKVETSSIVN